MNRRKILTRDILIVIIALAGIIGLALGTFMTDLIIGGSGSLRYVGGEARPLHVEGRYIKDDLNRTVFLRGVNKPTFASVDPTGWWQPEGGAYASGYNSWSEEAVVYNLEKMIELVGANALRLHLLVSHWYDNPTDPGGSGLTHRQMLRRVCELADERGMYIILDGFNNGVGGEAGGQSPLPWYPSNQYIADVQGFVDWWVSMSDYLRDLPNLVYDLWNEPHGWGGIPDFTISDWFDACQAVVDALRANGDDHIVLYQAGYTGMESNDMIAAGYLLTGGNIVYSIHTYRYIARYTPYFDGDYLYEDVEYDMLNNLLVQNLLDAGLAWGDFEFGCGIEGPAPDPENELIWLQSLLHFCNTYEGSYTEWLWWDISRNYGILKDSAVYPWCPPLNEAGEILRDAIAAGQT